MFKMVEVIREAFRNTRLIGSQEINNLALQNRNYVLKEHIAVGLYDVSVYVRRRFRRPFQGIVVNVYQTKSLRIAILPFEIVMELNKDPNLSNIFIGTLQSRFVITNREI